MRKNLKEFYAFFFAFVLLHQFFQRFLFCLDQPLLLPVIFQLKIQENNSGNSKDYKDQVYHKK